MKKNWNGTRPWLAALLLLAAGIAGCGGSGGRDPILGFDNAAPPTVTAVTPLNGATGVPVSNAVISATFSETMAPLGAGASFVLSCSAPCTSPTGTTSLDPSGRVLTFALPAGGQLTPRRSIPPP